MVPVRGESVASAKEPKPSGEPVDETADRTKVSARSTADSTAEDREDADTDYFEALINGAESIPEDDPIHRQLNHNGGHNGGNASLIDLNEAIETLSPELREVLDDRLRAEFREVRPYRKGQ